jgi:EAL domain-containing protein (putative c-di-GMP-specific phosphodiesterase class I)/DNA-binding NarL/FixJ family response regulator
MSATVRRVTVVIAEDEPHYRSALAALISSDARLQLVGVAGGEREAIELIARELPDAALVDVRMAAGGGAEVAREMRRRNLSTRVIAISAFTNQHAATAVLGAGAASYVSKLASPEEIVAAIIDTARGRRVLSDQMTSDLLDVLATHAAHDLADRREAAEIRHLLDTHGISSVVQPIVRLADRRVVGYEALSRFASGTCMARFASARHTGLDVDLGLAAIQVALATPELPNPERYLAINAGPRTITSPGFLAAIAHAPPEQLVVEITEHAPVEDYARLEAALAPLRAQGLRLAVDDAGAGFASLRHIVQLAPDIVKLDVSLTQGVEHDQVRRALARGLTSFAREAGIVLLAEGIETEAQLDEWAQLGVEYGQGYHFGRPEPAAASGLSRGGSSSC